MSRTLTLTNWVIDRTGTDFSIRIVAGDDFSESLEWTNTDGTPYDPTGATVVATILKANGETKSITTSWVTGSKTYLNLSLTREETVATKGTHSWWLTIEKDSHLITELRGKFEVRTRV